MWASARMNVGRGKDVSRQPKRETVRTTVCCRGARRIGQTRKKKIMLPEKKSRKKKRPMGPTA